LPQHNHCISKFDASYEEDTFNKVLKEKSIKIYNMPNRFKNIVIDPASRDWVKEYSDSFVPFTISYHFAEILGSCADLTDSIHFLFNKSKNKSGSIPYSNFSVSWKNCGFDKYDIKRLGVIHSNCKTKKKGNSVRGRGIRSVIENLYKDIDPKKLDSYTTYYSKHPEYKNGKLIAIVIAPGMKIAIRDASIEENDMYNEHMKNAHNFDNHTNNFGIYANFIVNLNRYNEIFNQNEVSPTIIKNLSLLLNRRIIHNNLKLVINNIHIKPHSSFIKSHPLNKYIEIKVTVGNRIISSSRGCCLRISDESLNKLRENKDPHFRNLHKIKKYINFKLGANNKTKILNSRNYYVQDNIENSWMMDDVERFESEKVQTEPGTWKDKEIILRFSTTISNSDDYEYLKHTCGKDGSCGVFFYSKNVLVNLRGDRTIIQGIMPNKFQFMHSNLNVIRRQIPTLEIEEKYIDLSNSKIITVPPIKASKPDGKKNNNFYKCFKKFVNKFFEEHIYYLESIPESESESDEESYVPQTNTIISPNLINENTVVISDNLEVMSDTEKDKSEQTQRKESEQTQRNINLNVSENANYNEKNIPNENILDDVKEELNSTTRSRKKTRVPIQENTKKDIAARQGFRCNNAPSGLVYKDNIKGKWNTLYDCPMWILYDGNFDRSRWEIDHIDNNPSNNDSNNLQALCPCCHSFKTLYDRRTISINSPTSR
jgi:hypothetical protein